MELSRSRVSRGRNNSRLDNDYDYNTEDEEIDEVEEEDEQDDDPGETRNGKPAKLHLYRGVRGIRGNDHRGSSDLPENPVTDAPNINTHNNDRRDNHGNQNGSKKEGVDKDMDDLFFTMKIPLLIGCLGGLTPLAEKNNRLDQHLGVQCHSWFSCRTLVSMLIIFLIGCNTLCFAIDVILRLSSSPHNSIGQIASSASGIWFFFSGFFVYLFCLLRSPKTWTYFHNWRKVSLKIRETTVPCRTLRRDVNLICIIVLLSALGENILFHIFSMRTSGILQSSVNFWDLLRDFYESNQYMKRIFDYSPVVAIVLFVVHKLTLFSWNFADVLLMMMFRVLSSRFRGINQYIERHMDFEAPLPLIKPGFISWRRVRRNFLLTVKSLDEADQIFYPLIWVSYTTNIFFVCNQLYVGIHDRSLKSAMHKMYVVWSFIHLASRTLAVNIFAARINDEVTQFSRLLQFSAPLEYDHSVRRLERFLCGRIIGITGNGIFVVTRSFILMIISAIFTLEVVLLQNSV